MSKVKTLCYGVAYFLCIPLFAFLFIRIPPENSFYQSTIKIENSYTKHADNIANSFCDAIMPNTSDKQTVSSYTFTREDLQCSKLRIENDDVLRFTMKVTLHKQQEKNEEIVSIPFIVTLDPFDIKIEYPEFLTFVPLSEWESATEKCALGFLHPIKVDTLSLPLMSPTDPNSPVTNSLKERLFTKRIPPSTLLLNNCFEHELATFLKESNGFTSNASDNCLRMLYLSAVTITTIGYGDIVPVAPEARLLVTIEAIVGAFLIGLFLNSLSPNRRPRRRSRSSPADAPRSARDR
jgi:ion channel